MNNTIYRMISFAVAVALAIGVSSRALASAAFDTAKQGGGAALLAGNTYYVSTAGRDTNPGTMSAPFKTFVKAVSVLMPGDTLQVMQGTYTEPLILSRSGTAAAPITVIGNGALLDMKSVKNYGIKISGSYINLSNFEVMGGLDNGITIPGKYITVKNNILHDNVTENGVGTCGIAGSYASALKVAVGGERITIENNKVYNNCGEGIAVTRGVNVVVKNNTVYDNFAPNIYIDNSPYSTVQGNMVYCTGARLGKDGKRPTGIGLGEESYSGWGAQMHDVLVIGNTIKDCKNGIGAFDSEVGGTLTNITLTQNYIPSAQNRSISITSDSNRNFLISYNTLFNAPYLSSQAGITLIGNIIGGSGPTPTSAAAPTSTSVAAPTRTPTAILPAATATASPAAANTAAPTLALSATPTTAASTTPTLGATAPSTPTAVPSQAPTNPPAAIEQAADPIFASSFESGDFSEWSGNANGSGDLSVSPSAALAGANGLQAVINDSTVMSVTSNHPNAEPRYRARFYFDPNSIAMASGNAHIILRGYSGSSTVALRVEFGFAASGYQIRAALVNDGSTWTDTPWFAISDAPHAIEVDWRAATGAGANNGGLTLWIDGAQQADLTGIDNDTRRIDRAMLGALAALDTGTAGTYFFDAFESRRQSYIGP